MTRWYMKPQFSCAETDTDPAATKKAAAAMAIVCCFSDIEYPLVSFLDKYMGITDDALSILFVIIYIRRPKCCKPRRAPALRVEKVGGRPRPWKNAPCEVGAALCFPVVGS